MTTPNEDLVIVDTCVWASFFKRSGGDIKNAVTQLLEHDRVAIVGPIATEVLQGFRDERQADWVASALDGVNLISLGWTDWRSAATLGRRLASRGHKLPLTDLVIASVCQRLPCSLFSTDPHFDAIEDITRFTLNDI